MTNKPLVHPSPPGIREIACADIPSLFDVRIQTWHNSNGAVELDQLGITIHSVQAMLESTHRGWLAESDGSVVGFAMGNAETAEMWVIAVLPSHENQGIGRTLLARVEDWLASLGHEEAWLTTDPDPNVRAVGFYQRCGWQDWKLADGDRYMRKSLQYHRNA